MKIEQFRRLEDGEYVVYLERIEEGAHGLRLLLSKARDGKPNFNVRTVFGGDVADKIKAKDIEFYYEGIFTVETFRRLSMEVREEIVRTLTLH
jgi:hypothetical protein